MGAPNQTMESLNDNLGLKLFVEFLHGGLNRPPLSSTQWLALENKFGPTMYSDVLFLLTQTEFDPLEAREHWYNLLEHRLRLTEELDRDPGFEVAICDYFNNIHRHPIGLIAAQIQVRVEKERSVLIDSLTGLYNRRFLKRVLEKEEENCKRYGQSFALLILQVDPLSDYYRIFGKQAGDKTVVELAEAFYRTARAIDYLIRYDTEKFILILPRCEKSQALTAAERHRHAASLCSSSDNNRERTDPLTVTIGLAAYPHDAHSGQRLIELADIALQRGMEAGRNRSVAWN